MADKPTVYVDIELKPPSSADIIKAADVIKRGFEKALKDLGKTSVQQLTKELEKAGRSGRKTGSELTKGAKQAGDALDRAAQAAKEMEAHLEQLARAEKQAFVNALQHAKSAKQVATEMLKAAAATEKNYDALQDLTDQTRTFSTQEQAAAKRVAELEKEVQDLIFKWERDEASTKDVADATIRLQQAYRQLQTTMAQTARSTQELTKEKNALFVRSLPVETQAQRTAQAMLQEAQAADATEDQLRQLAKASGAFGSGTIETASEVSRLTIELEELTRAYLRNEATADDVEKATANLNTALARTTTETEKQVRHGDVWNKQFVARRLISIGLGLATYQLVDALGRLAKGSVQASVEFEASFTRIGKTVDDVFNSINQLTLLGSRLRLEFRRLAEVTPINVNELNRIGELGGQLGVATGDLARFADLISRLTFTTNLKDVEDASLSFARLQNILQLSQDELEQYASAVVDLGNNFATTESEIVRFSRRIAGIGAAVGLTAADIAAIATAFSSVGVEVESGGTAIQTFLVAMLNAVNEGGPKLEKFANVVGMTADEFGALFREDAGAAFVEVVRGIAGAGEDASFVIADLVTKNVRLQRAFLTIAAAGDELEDALKRSRVAYAENTALQRESELQYTTSQSAIERLKNSWELYKGALGDTLEIKRASNAIAELLNQATRALDFRQQIQSLEALLFFLGAGSKLPEGVVLTDEGQIEVTERATAATVKYAEAVEKLVLAAQEGYILGDVLTGATTFRLDPETTAKNMENLVAIVQVLGFDALPTAEEGIKAFLAGIRELDGGVEEYIVTQLVANGTIHAGLGTQRQLIEDLRTGKITIEALAAAFAPLIAANQETEETGIQVSSAERELYENFLRLYGLLPEVSDELTDQRDALRELEGAFDELSRQALPKYIDLIIQASEAAGTFATANADDAVEAADEYVAALEEIDSALIDLAVGFLEAAGQSEEFQGQLITQPESILAFRHGIGQLTDQMYVTAGEAQNLVYQLEQLFLAAVQTDMSVETLTLAYQLLVLEIANTADEALLMAQDEETATAAIAAKITKIKELNQALIDQARQAKIYRDVLIDQIRTAIDAAEATDDLRAVLIEQAITAGATAEQILELAVATGLLTSEEIGNAEAHAQLAAKADDLYTLIRLGTLTADQAAAAFLNFADSLSFTEAAVGSLGQAARETFGGGFAGTLDDYLGYYEDLSGSGGTSSRTTKVKVDEYAKYFVSALKELRKAAEDSDYELETLGESMLDLAVESGATAEQVLALGVAMGEVSAEEAAAAFSRLAAQQGLEAIADAYIKGALSAEEAGAAVMLLQEQLASGAEISLEQYGLALGRVDEAQQAVGSSAKAAEEPVTNWALELLKAAEGAKISAQDMLVLAENTGLFDEKALNAAISSGLLKSAVDTLAGGLEEIDAVDAAAAITELETALATASQNLSPETLASAVDFIFEQQLTPEKAAAYIQAFTALVAEAAEAGTGVTPLSVPLDVILAADQTQLQQFFDGIREGKPVLEAFLELQTVVDDPQGAVDDAFDEVAALIELEADPEQVRQALSEAGFTADLSLGGDTSDALEGVGEISQAASEADATVTIDADNTAALKGAQEVYDYVDKTKATIPLEVDDSDARRTVLEFLAWMNSHDFTVPTPGVTRPSGNGGEGEFALGGYVTGPQGVDAVVARLTAGEFVLPVDVVDRVGLPFLEALRSGQVSIPQLSGSIPPAFEQSLANAFGALGGPVVPVTSNTSIAVNRSVTNAQTYNNYYGDSYMALPPNTPVIPVSELGG